jgi:hypothetical protein
MKWHCSDPNAPSALPSTSNRRSSARRALTAYCGGWRHCACSDAKTRFFAVGALASTTCNNFIADLLFLSEVSHSLLVAGPPCVHPYLGKWALQPPPTPEPKRAAGSGGWWWGCWGSGAGAVVGGAGAAGAAAIDCQQPGQLPLHTCSASVLCSGSSGSGGSRPSATGSEHRVASSE